MQFCFTSHCVQFNEQRLILVNATGDPWEIIQIAIEMCDGFGEMLSIFMQNNNFELFT